MAKKQKYGKRKYYALPDEREQEIIDNAEYYTASVRLGVGQVVKHECKTLEDVAASARALADYYQKRCIIYAVKGASQAYLTTAEPVKVK